MTNRDKEKVIRAYISAYNRFDIDGMTTYLHPDVRFKNFSNDELTAEADGVAQFRRLAVESKQLFSTRRQVLTRFGFENEVVIVDVSFEGVLAVNVPGLARAGETLKVAGKSEFEFADEKLVRITDMS